MDFIKVNDNTYLNIDKIESVEVHRDLDNEREYASVLMASGERYRVDDTSALLHRLKMAVINAHNREYNRGCNYVPE